jgi:eukaryotic-like serine/threonine-protein kinase
MLWLAVDEHPLPGQVISGRFRLERLLGQGGMGTVWEARHLSLETQIAIKFLNADLSRRRDVLARFGREATSAARIRSPHVVSILDSGFTDNGLGFIAMELLRGEDLGRRLTRFGKLTISETALLVTQVARGLAKAHSVNVVHRDLKPENIFVVDEDDAFVIKILDFGIAKSLAPEASTHKTDTGQILGTPLYMSPEQALGHEIDSRSDLYSLAVVAYRCLTGRPPFINPTAGQLIVAVGTQASPPPSQFNADLPSALDDWFAGALAKDPNERTWQRAHELAESFNRACGNALDGVPHPSDQLRSARPRQSYPPAPGSSETPVPSREEIATTVVAAQFQLSPGSRPARRSFVRRWAPGLGVVAVAGAVTAAFRGPVQPVQPAPAKASFSAALGKKSTPPSPTPKVQELPPESHSSSAPKTPPLTGKVTPKNAKPGQLLAALPSAIPRDAKANAVADPESTPAAGSEAPPIQEQPNARGGIVPALAPKPEPSGKLVIDRTPL